MQRIASSLLPFVFLLAACGGSISEGSACDMARASLEGRIAKQQIKDLKFKECVDFESQSDAGIAHITTSAEYAKCWGYDEFNTCSTPQSKWDATAAHRNKFRFKKTDQGWKLN